ncbi:prephenate dehydrogenase [Micromonospora sp. KC207]|nr:prephenate dehydrogenase [Micromonospora sp. KC207]
MTFRRCVVVGGGGAVGAMFADLLRQSGSDPLIVDLVPGGTDPVRWLVADITDPDPASAEAITRADLVLLAVHEQVALKAVGPVTDLMRPGAVLADTLSVKTRMAAELEARAIDIQHVGLNPMFAPAAGMPGRPVAAVVTRDGPGVTALLGLVERWGGRLVRCTPEQHDRTTAASQALTHAMILSFGLALPKLGVDVEQLTATAPPPHLTLLALLARVLDGSPEVYEEIQRVNPYANAARQALADGLRAFTSVVDDGEQGLDATFEDLRRLMGTGLGEHQKRCREVVRIIHQTGGGDTNQ